MERMRWMYKIITSKRRQRYARTVHGLALCKRLYIQEPAYFIYSICILAHNNIRIFIGF